MRRLLLVVMVALALPLAALASEWGNIIPGTSTMEAVRGQHGGPTKTETQKTDNYDTTSWLYEGAQAPVGLLRMVVEFGILQAGGYRRDVVRSFKIEPKPGVFHRRIVLSGWGAPERAPAARQRSSSGARLTPAPCFSKGLCYHERPARQPGATRLGWARISA